MRNVEVLTGRAPGCAAPSSSCKQPRLPKTTPIKLTKLVGIVAAFAVWVVHLEAQDGKAVPREARTKLEAFEATTGTVLIKGIEHVGSLAGLGSVTVGCREFTDASSGRKEYGITVQVKEGGRLEREDRTFIDYEEIDSLLKGIDYIAKLDKSVTALPEFEAVYATKGGLRVVTFSSGGQIRAAVSSGHIGPATAFLSLDQLSKFRSLIHTAKVKLDSIRRER